MENNSENKVKFFAQYQGQDILFMRDEHDLALWKVQIYTDDIEEWHLLLTPLSKITDEDAIEVSKRQGWRNQTIHKIHFDNDAKDFSVNYGKDDCYETVNSYTFSYLQLKGYALPFHNLSVDDLVGYGWVVLS